MAEEKTMRLSLVAKQINVGTSTILQFLSAKGHKIDNNPNAKLNFEQLTLLAKEYGANHILESSVEAPKPAPAPEPVATAPAPEPAKAPEPVVEKPAPAPEAPKAPEAPAPVAEAPAEEKPAPAPSPKPEPTPAAEEVVEDVELIEARGETLKGLTVLGKIDLPAAGDRGNNAKHKRKRIIKEEKIPAPSVPGTGGGRPGDKKDFNKKPAPGAKPAPKGELSDKDIQEQIKATMARLQGATNKQSFGADKRREKRKGRAEAEEARMMAEDEEAKVLKVTEFISASDLASLMDVSVNEVISTCMSLGMFVSINQRLDAEAITVIADEFAYEVSFVSAEEEIDVAEVEVEDSPEDLLPRAPIVTIMGHVDHGKTSLLDYIRRAKVAAGEAGGITQHIGAYSVETKSGKKVTFLDTPGHEAFTAMRARGAKVTDIVIIVIAADDSVMPQTKEAINHSMVAGVPIVFAFSKIDKDGANSDKVREELAAMNMLVEDWGGKYQCQEISSKSGQGIDDLLEKVL